jgi:hypothetical protein
MLRTTSSVTQALTRFIEAVWLDLSAEAGKFLVGVGNESKLRKAGWKAYDAWINLANELTNEAYSDPLVGAAIGQAMEWALRFQQIGAATTAAAFGRLWPSIGLPTHNELAALRDELLVLREELAAYAARLPASDAAAGTESQHASRAAWKSAQLNGYGAANGNGNMANDNGGVRRFVHQEKRHAAACGSWILDGTSNTRA